MSQLYQPDEEGAQLREVARAHAGGAVSRDDYRAIRSALLESHATAPAAGPERAASAAPAGAGAGAWPALERAMRRESPAGVIGWLAAGGGVVLAACGALALL